MHALVDVTHPAHVHLFRNAITALEERGHEVSVASREKDVTTELLDAYGIEHTPLTGKQTGRFALPREWVSRELRLFRFMRATSPDVVLSHLNPAAAHVSRALGVPNVVFHDTEVAGLVERFTAPFAEVVCTPAEFDREVPVRQLRYEGFHELAYLHPARFEADPQPLYEAGIDPYEPFSVVRLVAMDAHHDHGSGGFSREQVADLVEGLSEHGDVYVTGENDLPDELGAYEAPTPPEAMLDLLAFADLYVGDSGTMATEAGLLATPAVRYNPLDSEMSVFEELAEYGLVTSTMDADEAVERALTLAADPDAGARWRRRRRELLAEKVDVTALAVELAEEVGGP